MTAWSFAAPQWLVVLAALPIVWLFAWRHRTPFGRARLWALTALRSGVVAACALALADPVSTSATRGISVVYAIDVSRSVSTEFLRTAIAWIRDANRTGRPEQARYVVFGDRARMVESVEAIGSVPVTGDATDADEQAVGQSGTDLERALDGALPGFAPNLAKRLVLISDGNQTDGDVWRAIPHLRAQGVRLFAIASAVAAGRAAWIEGVESREGVREQEPATVAVRVFGAVPLRATVRLSVDAVDAGAQTRELVAGENLFVFPVTFKHAGTATLEATLARTGPPEALDRAEQLTQVGPRPKVLYVEGNSASVPYLRDALKAQGVDVDAVTPEALASGRARLGAADALVLSDVAAAALDRATSTRVEQFVREGGALLFAAGENTYGAEGYAKSGLEDVLPVKFEGPRKRKELDLVIMIDRSYSMHGKTLEYAKTAALSALDRLEEHHRLSVVAFDSQPHEIVPLRAVGNKRHAEDLISEISASGETNIFNALWHAYKLLRTSEADAKHVVLISDGDTAPPFDPDSPAAKARDEIEKTYGVNAKALLHAEHRDPDRAQQPKGFDGMARLYAEKNISLSTVAIGEKPKIEFLQNLSRWTRGTHYVAIGDAEIPALLIKDTNKLLGESFVEEAFRPTVKTQTAALDGIDFARGPALKGFVIAHAKPSSEVVLMAKDDHPLLVQNHHGLGRTIAFASDLKNRWGVDWLGWQGYGKLWAQTIRDAIRRDRGEGLQFRVNRDRRDARVELVARGLDGTFRNGLAPKVRITAPDGTSTVIALDQSAPGSYLGRATLSTSAARAYRFELLPTPGIATDDAARAGVRSLFFDRVDEDLGLPPDRTLLAALCDAAGGRFSPSVEQVFAMRGDGGTTTTAWWTLFAAAALALYLCDVIARRVGWRQSGAKPVVGGTR
jgi:Ca-activated chloride channel homolog